MPRLFGLQRLSLFPVASSSSSSSSSFSSSFSFFFSSFVLLFLSVTEYEYDTTSFTVNESVYGCCQYFPAPAKDCQSDKVESLCMHP